MDKKHSAKPATIRLNKFIANAGICSRREADMHIGLGTVTVNGKIITEMGHQVKTGDEVRFDGRKINADKPTYVLLNKPKGFLAPIKKGNYKKDVAELVSNATSKRIDPVHAMDRTATGLLLFTNDMELIEKLRAPKTRIRKVYQIVLDKNLASEDFKKIKSGISPDHKTRWEVEEISYISGQPKRVVGIEIHSQVYKISHQIFSHLGYEIEQIDQVTYGHLTKKDLPRGKWKHLTQDEVRLFKMFK